MLEFAWVLVLKEKYDRNLGETTHDTDESESGKVISRETKEMRNTKGRVLPLEELNHNIDMHGRTESRQASFWVRNPKFFEKLPLTRRIDFLAFIVYHLAYIFFNVIYWNQC